MTSPDFKTYRCYDWTAPGTYEYKLESVSIRGECEQYAKLAGPVAVDALDVSLSDDGTQAALASVTLSHELQRAERLSVSFASLAQAQDSAQPQATVMANAAIASRSAPALVYDPRGTLVLAAAIREIDADTAVSLATGSAAPPAAANTARSRAAAAQDAQGGAAWV